VQLLEIVDVLLKNFRYNYWFYAFGFSFVGFLLRNIAFSVTVALYGLYISFALHFTILTSIFLFLQALRS